MNYVDGFVLAVPTANRETYQRVAETAAVVFKENGALSVRTDDRRSLHEGLLGSGSRVLHGGPYLMYRDLRNVFHEPAAAADDASCSAARICPRGGRPNSSHSSARQTAPSMARICQRSRESACSTIPGMPRRTLPVAVQELSATSGSDSE